VGLPAFPVKPIPKGGLDGVYAISADQILKHSQLIQINAAASFAIAVKHAGGVIATVARFQT